MRICRAGISVVAALCVLVALAGCSAEVNGADSASAPSQSLSLSETSNQGQLVPCPGTMCAYGVNKTQVYTAPGQLGPATYTLAGQSNHFVAHGEVPYPWQDSWPGTPGTTQCPDYSQAQVCMIAVSDRMGGTSTATFRPPNPLPQTDLINLNAGSGEAPAGSCGTSNYTACTLVFNDASTNDDQFDHYGNEVFYITNQPLMIEVRNNLSAFQSDTISIGTDQPCQSKPTQLPQTQNMVCDPAGTNAQSLDGGQTGYFGLYVPVSTQGLLPGGPSVSFTYTVSSDSGDNLGGATFTVNVSTTKGAVNISPSTPGGGVCTVQVPNVQYSAYCNVALQGAAGGPQTLIISIGE